MGYKRMEKEDLYEIHRRWRAHHSISRIAEALGLDRKTVRQYIERFLEARLAQEGPEATKKALYELFAQILPFTERNKPAWKELSKYEQEIRELILDEKEPVKPKTAYQILKHKHRLKASYESFKGFVRARGLSAKPRKQVYVIELPPAKEKQVDYGKVGLLEDPVAGKNRVVWAFCSVLSHSRLPFIEYVYTQKKESFVQSMIDSLEFYEGCTEFISIDNLKSGVIKPDLWDPKLNKSLAEMAEYYGVFIDPCRVGRSTDKGKIERMIPVARELFRMLKRLHPGASLNELNRYARQWCREEYGRRKHGTTKIPPLEAFESAEKPLLRPLPEERFEVPVWQKLSVHAGDGFFTFGGKRFAVPAFRGKTVFQSRSPDNLLEFTRILTTTGAKRTAKTMVSYLTELELEILFQQPDIKTRQGRRDLVLLVLLYDTAARVQELADIRVKDVRLVSPSVITLRGKGNKYRQVPIMNRTKDLLQGFLEDHKKHNWGTAIGEAPLFSNPRHQKLSRWGVSHILNKYVELARKDIRFNVGFPVTPHVLRHAKAMGMVKADIPLLYIRDFLGHCHVSTTEVYARADTEKKRVALEASYSDLLPCGFPKWEDNDDLMEWLSKLC